jgi:phosphoglycolate phosphatase-like HAD superfamily hydrolase
MQRSTTSLLFAALLFVVMWVGFADAAHAARDPLPSWNEGATKSAIIDFVARVTDRHSKDFVPEPERIAVFDNDGTLWSEQPLYFQGFYALARIRAMAPDHPDWPTTEPFKSAMAGDMKGLMATGEKGVMQVLLTAHSGVTATGFADSVADWAATAKRPQTGMLFTQMIFKPMLELLDYLRAKGFKTFIVSGGGVDFMRVFAERVYGIPPEQVVGTTGDAKFEMVDGIPTIIKEPKIMLVDDKAGKPVGIYRNIGRRPIFAAGNSDGDQQMLEYTTIPRDANDTTPRFGLIVHHTDGEREFAYDRESHMGRLDAALDEAPSRGWTVVDMKADWRTIYPTTR